MTKDVYWAGSTTTFQEPVFVPRRGCEKEGEGYLIALVNHLDVLRNDVLIFDALELSKGPLAVVHLPFKVRLGVHGNWVDQGDIEEWEKRRGEGGDVGKVKIAENPLPWQVEMEKVPRGERFVME